MYNYVLQLLVDRLLDSSNCDLLCSKSETKRLSSTKHSRTHFCHLLAQLETIQIANVGYAIQV